MAVLSQAERAQVEERIRAVESASSAEIVVATLPRASDYAGARWYVAALLALALGALLHLVFPELTIGALFIVQIAVLFGAFRVLALPKLARRVATRAQIDAAVAAAAERLFLAHRVFETRAQTGVLILLCELEHRVTVLGDRGAHAVVQQAGWEAHVKTITEALRAGRAADGLCVTIDALGRTLARGLPRPHDDVNELSNHVREHTRL